MITGCPDCKDSGKVETVCRRCGGRRETTRPDAAVTAAAMLARLRTSQEHILRWVITLVFLACAVAFCVGLGSVAASTTIGEFFGALISGLLFCWLWAREFHEARIAHERAAFATPTRFNADVGEPEDPPELAAPTAEIRTTYYDDEDPDDD